MARIIPFPIKPHWARLAVQVWNERLDRLADYLAVLKVKDSMMAHSPGMTDMPVEDATTLVIMRTLDAPRALVWKMFSDPYRLAQWWGPEGYSNRVVLFDLRTGGRWLHVMIGPDGREYPTDSDILEVTPPERFVYRNAAADPKIFGDNPPPSFTKTLTLTEADGQTVLAVVCTFDAAAQKNAVVRRGFITGTNQSFDKLERHLKTL
jgi:uncharacterized protein YndB with AHSA1/START domain